MQPSNCAHVIQIGENLDSIAKQHKTTTQAVLAVNLSIADPDHITPRQVSRIPQSDVDCDTMQMCANYIVKEGDTLFHIAQCYGTSVRAVVDGKPEIKIPDIIFLRQIIRIPPCSEKLEPL